MKCFYHKDLDGECSGAIVKMVYPDCEMLGIQYGEDFPWASIQQDEAVFMVDFALQPFTGMFELRDRVNLVWIDHHETAIKEWQDASPDGKGLDFIGVRRCGISACELTWEYLKETPIPDFVRLLGRYDVYDHSDPATLPFQFGMRLLDTSPDNQELWFSLFDIERVQRIIADGEIVLKYQAQDNAKYCAACAFDTEFEGLRCIAVNKMLINSKIFDSVWDPEKYDMMIAFGWIKDKWTISLYATDPEIDVGVIAKVYGGGGHRGAAGFQSKELMFTFGWRKGQSMVFLYTTDPKIDVNEIAKIHDGGYCGATGFQTKD